MNLTRLLLVAVGCAALTMALVACGDDDDDNGDEEGTPTTAAPDDDRGSPSPTATISQGNDFTPPPGGSGTTIDVKTENFAFDPAEIGVPAGEPITFRFTNADAAPHTFTLYLDEEFTQAIPGASASADTPEITLSFVDPGEYFFRCEIHPDQMQGQLIAE